MISMTAGFTAEKNKKIGAAPVWILKIPFVAGTLYLSDRALSISPISIGSDLVSNGGFTVNTADWTAQNSTIASVAGGQDGNCCELTVTGEATQTVYQTAGIATTVGKIYRLTLHVKSGTAGDTGFTIAAFDDAWGLHSSQSGVTTGSWVHYSLCFTATTATSNFYVRKDSATAGTMLIDSISCYESAEITPWIASWGSINEDLTDQLTTPIVSDFSAEIIIDPAEATDIHDLLWSETVETIDCELYLWFEGLNAATDPPILRWTGNITDFERVSELLYRIDFTDPGLAKNGYPGRVLSLADYSNAALDDVGYQLPIIYGSVEKSPALRLDVGKKTALTSAIDNNDVDFYLGSGDGLVNTDTIIIDAEQITITTITGNHITACTRGANSTTAVSHGAGSLVYEKQASCVYMVADHPVKAINNIYAMRPDGVMIDVTSLCTKYTGNGGGTDLAGYAGKAVITSPGYLTFNQAAAVGYSTDLSGGELPIITWNFDTVLSTVSTGRWIINNPENITDGNANTQAAVIYVSGDSTRLILTRAFYGAAQGVPLRSRVAIKGAAESSNIFYHSFYGATINLQSTGTANVAITRSGWTTNINGSLWAEVATVNSTLVINGGAAGGTNYIHEAWAEIEYDPGAVLTGTVTIMGDRLYVDCDGYADDGSGTFTGTGSALIEQPDHIFKHFLYTYAGLAVANFSTDAAASFAADGYVFSVVMNSRKKIREWCTYMALQCRCFFRWANDKAYLLYRPDSLTSDKTITSSMIAANEDNTTTLQVRRSPLDEVINKVDLKYKPDWSKPIEQRTYRAVASTWSTASTAAYGDKERPDTFQFDFVADGTMAADLANFYVTRYKDRKKEISFAGFLDNFEIEFADVLTIAPLASVVCEVRNAGVAPGYGTQNDKVLITVREY